MSAAPNAVPRGIEIYDGHAHRHHNISSQYQASLFTPPINIRGQRDSGIISSTHFRYLIDEAVVELDISTPSTNGLLTTGIEHNVLYRHLTSSA